MKKIFNKVFNKENIPYLILAVMMLFIFNNIVITAGDDEWFSTILDKNFNGDLISYLKERYMEWTGRIIIEAIMVPMFKYNIWIWRVFNTIVTIILVFGIYKLIPYKYVDKLSVNKRLLVKSIICISIFSIPKSVFSTAISWITGSYNYLLPLALGLLVIIPFKNALFNEKINKKWYIVLVFITLLAANMEQVSLIILCFALLINIYIYIRYKKIRIDLIIFNIFISINTFMLFLAPGNYKRSDKEIVTWFSQWDMVSLSTKIMMGINLFLEHIFESNIILIAVLVALINIVIWKKYKSKLIKGVSAIPMIVIVIKLLELKLESFNINTDLLIFKILNVQNLNILNYDKITIFLPTAILLFIILIIPVIFLFIFDDVEMKYLSIILYLASICSAISISVSPTIYASGARIFFVTDILIIIIIALILSEFLRKWKVNIYLALVLIIIFKNSFVEYFQKVLS